MPTYRIEVVTGELSPDALARSDAKIRVTLYGSSGSTDELVLDPNRSPGNGVDTFLLRLGELGDVQRLRVGYDDTGLSPAWFLEGIAVHNEGTGASWSFPCHRWLARHRDDGEIERVLDAA